MLTPLERSTPNMNATPDTPNDREEPVDGVTAPGADNVDTTENNDTNHPVTSTPDSAQPQSPATSDADSTDHTADDTRTSETHGSAATASETPAPASAPAAPVHDPAAASAPAAASTPSSAATPTPAPTPVNEPAAHQQPAAQHPSTPQSAPTNPYARPQDNHATAAPNAPYGAPTGAAFGAAATAGTSGTSADGATTATASGEPKKKSVLVPVFAALAVGAIIGGASGAGIAAAFVGSNNDTGTVAQGSGQTITVNDTESVNVVTAVAAKAGPSVVTISVAGASGAGTGSGVILDDEGHILTNTHVVTLDGASADGTIEVSTYDGRLYSAQIVGTDPITDLAVIKLDDATDLTPIEWGDSDSLNVGDTSIAIGAPLGLSNTVTDGIVSALNRSIQIASSAAPENEDSEQAPDNNGQDSPFDFWSFGDQQQGQQGSSQSSTISIPVVQTDAAINPGNSGGALVDNQGRLIGINVAIASTGSTDASAQSGSIGVGFAVPSNLAKRISEELIADGTASHGLLGASVQNATSSDGSVVGALIAQAPIAGGAAAEAGLRQGDVVTKFNGAPITSSTDLTAQVRTLAPGETAELTYVRGDRSTTVEVTLGSLEDS
ncbi:MAG: trypsin-like peptidase domain-containing protein [Ilumatobacteraceae bacterium]